MHIFNEYFLEWKGCRKWPFWPSWLYSRYLDLRTKAKVIHASTSLRQIGYQKVKCKRRNMLAYVVYYRYQDLHWAWFLLLALKAIKMLITFSACTKDNKANPFFSHFPVDKCTLGLRPNVHGTWILVMTSSGKEKVKQERRDFAPWSQAYKLAI